jgi:hypothetical protein
LVTTLALTLIRSSGRSIIHRSAFMVETVRRAIRKYVSPPITLCSKGRPGIRRPPDDRDFALIPRCAAWDSSSGVGFSQRMIAFRITHPNDLRCRGREPARRCSKANVCFGVPIARSRQSVYGHSVA